MDRVLELTDPILVSLEDSPDILRNLAASDDIWPFVLQQLSASAWAYIVGENICIVTRSFTAMARVEHYQSEDVVLVLKKIDRTTPQDVTSAFREGYKITATWTFDEAGQSQTGSPSGAVQLWTMLGGEEAGDISCSSSLSLSKQETLPDALIKPQTRIISSEKDTAIPEGPILPQSEIDRLIAAMRDKTIAEDKPGREQPTTVMPESTIGQYPPIQEVEANVQPEQASSQQEIENQVQHQLATPQVNWEEEDKHPTYPPHGGLNTGVSLDEWTDTPNQTTKPPESFLPPESASTLGEFVAGQSYVVVIFERREDFDHEFENLRDIVPGTILASWDNHTIFARLGMRLSQIIEGYRTKYRATAASLETSITRLRQHEQLLPNLQKYREQQETLSNEAEKMNHEMHTMKMKQVLETHEGRFLARKVFGIEAMRQSLAQDLMHLSYTVIKRSIPSFLIRSRFTRHRLKYITVQRQLEASFNKLANLEREVQRRLEYQADWQALVSRQFKIQREQEEIGRFIKATANTPGGPSTDAESLNRWLKSEWEAVRLRERLLRAWQECLTDEKAWSVRTIDEPVVVLGDRSLLTLPGVARGAFVIALAQNHTTIMSEAPEECTGWVMVDPGLRTMGSGRGMGLNGDSFLATISDLAKEMGLGTQEALQFLGFEDRIKQGMG